MSHSILLRRGCSLKDYPSIIIFCYDCTERGNIERDMEAEDFRAEQYAVDNLLK